MLLEFKTTSVAAQTPPITVTSLLISFSCSRKIYFFDWQTKVHYLSEKLWQKGSFSVLPRLQGINYRRIIAFSIFKKNMGKKIFFAETAFIVSSVEKWIRSQFCFLRLQGKPETSPSFTSFVSKLSCVSDCKLRKRQVCWNSHFYTTFLYTILYIKTHLWL